MLHSLDDSLHARNLWYWSIPSTDTADQKILQSDKWTAFWVITAEPDFPHTFVESYRILSLSTLLGLKKDTSMDQTFGNRKKTFELIWRFLAFSPNENFLIFGFVNFWPRPSDFTSNFRKILDRFSVNVLTDLLIYWPTESGNSIWPSPLLNTGIQKDCYIAFSFNAFQMKILELLLFSLRAWVQLNAGFKDRCIKLFPAHQGLKGMHLVK